jgi:hypothetical protein
MKEQIIAVLGKNHKGPIAFDPINGFYGLYTYRGSVYVFKNGEESDYDDLDESDKKELLKAVLSKKWKVLKSLQ